MKKKRILFGLIILFIIASFLGLYILKTHPRYYTKVKCYVKMIAGKIKYDNISNKTYKGELKNDSYYLHRKAAKQSGVPLIRNNKELNGFLKKGLLVKVSDNEGYKLHRMNYSAHVLSKKSYNMLKNIGDSFQEKAGKCQYFTITSLTRTVASQKRLTKSNINATRNISTHSYGASFDISYVRFNGKKRQNRKLQKILEDILIDLKKQNKIYVIYERKSSCYHVTTR